MTGAEAAGRRLARGRAAGWLLAYPLLAAAGWRALPASRRSRTDAPALLAGLLLAAAGYPLGCRLLGHRWSGRPPDPLWVEMLALAGVVAPVEELVWGRQVEGRLGIAVTAPLFAAKHVAIDGRWRRAGGLALFWVGLGTVRRRSRRAALGIHILANASGVALGHLSGRDHF